MSNLELGRYNGTLIVFTDENKINLTDMWKAGDGRASQSPYEWLRHTDTVRFLESLDKKVNTGDTLFEVVTTTRGGTNPGTWGHYQVAIRYAQYLNDDFAMWVTEVVKEKIETQGVPSEPFQIPKTFAEALMLAGRQAEQMALDAPKVQVYNEIMSSEGLTDLTTAFKNMGLHPNHMMRWCRSKGYLYYGSGGGSSPINLPMTQYIKQGLFEIISISKKTGFNKQTMLTPKGIDYFTQKKLDGWIPYNVYIKVTA